jgi:hypothetical protein
MYRVPESISLPNYSSGAEPYRWYDTPDRGPCWLEHGDRGDVLIPHNKMRFFYRDSAFNSRQFSNVEEYLENTLQYVRLNENGTLSYLDQDNGDPRVARIHPVYISRFASAWQEIYDAGIRYDIDRLSSFRFMGTSRQRYPYLSQHGMGLSIDFNPSHNDWEAGIRPDYDETFMRIMARHGFRPPIIWGSHEDGHDHGYESVNADWMHFDMVPDEDGNLRDNYSSDLEDRLERFA